MTKTSKYSDKLKDPRWQKKRLEILNLHEFKCEKCGCEEKELHVHHRFYLRGREVWQYDNDVFQVLCVDCHEKEHKTKEKIIEVIPKKYNELILIVERLNKINGNNQELLEYFLKTIISEQEKHDLEYSFYNFVDVYCNRTYGDYIKYQINEYVSKENDEILFWSTINELKSQIKELTNG